MQKISHAMRRCNYLIAEIDAAYRDFSQKMGVADSVMRILYVVWNDDGRRCSLQQICRLSGISKQTVNSALRKMEADGLIYLEKADAKRKDVCLTEAGRALAARTAGRLTRVENAIFADWDDEDVRQYLALTQRYLASFCEKAELEAGEETT